MYQFIKSRPQIRTVHMFRHDVAGACSGPGDEVQRDKPGLPHSLDRPTPHTVRHRLPPVLCQEVWHQLFGGQHALPSWRLSGMFVKHYFDRVAKIG